MLSATLVLGDSTINGVRVTPIPVVLPAAKKRRMQRSLTQLNLDCWAAQAVCQSAVSVP
jgi:hypothetical protein